MIYYRLLRDNKETGPYSEEEMIAKGFKPYDLLWAEGKTAGWQYPSEISVFRQYAPIIEEQPFDRFYKKQPIQSGTVQENGAYAYTPPEIKSIAYSRPLHVDAAASRPNGQDSSTRHIHVTLPSGNTVNLTTLVAKKESKEPASAESNTTVPVKEYLPLTGEPVLKEKKQTSFAENISVPQQPKEIEAKINTTTRPAPVGTANHIIQQPAYQSSGNSFSWTLLAGAALGIATLVGLGIMIGLSINRQKNDGYFEEALRRKEVKIPVTVTQKPIAVPPVAGPLAAADLPVSVSVATPAKKELAKNAVLKTVIPAGGNTGKEQPASLPASLATDKNKQVQNSGNRCCRQNLCPWLRRPKYKKACASVQMILKKALLAVSRV